MAVIISQVSETHSSFDNSFFDKTDKEIMSKHTQLLVIEPAVWVFILEALSDGTVLSDDLPLSAIFHQNHYIHKDFTSRPGIFISSTIFLKCIKQI